MTVLVQIRNEAERIDKVTWSAAALGFFSLLAAGEIWATVVDMDLLADSQILAMSATLVAAFWLVVAGGVVIGHMASDRDRPSAAI